MKANQEDYSTIIPMYPISRHANAKAGISNMDRTIEKCRKAIKLHSIKVKPKKNFKKGNSPEYLIYYNQQEFNPALKEAWLLLAQAEFHKGDFLGSAATFSYIARHFPGDKNMIIKCQLWIARAYSEMAWIYEAEQMLSKLEQDDLKRENIGLFAAVNADLLLKKRQYKEAIPFLELTLSKENDKDLKQRFGFLLAQLYQKTGNDKAAYEAFSTVIKANPPFEMDFNARICRAQIDKGNVVSVRKDLRRMLKNSNNKDYLDQLYFAIGNTYLHRGDTLKAIENYRLSAENSKRNGVDKAVSLITLGDLYYLRRNFVLAQPCYEEASKLITNENDDFARVTKRAEMLSELVTQNDIVVLQDSLQHLATMPESKRLEVVNDLIARLIAEEKATAEKLLKKSNNGNQEDEFANLTPIGGNLPGAAGDWYFYNSNLRRSGQTEFLKKWGKRKLEDNWRRTNKTTSLFADENIVNTAVKDSTDTISKPNTISDIKDPEFYLRQIPVTASQINNSNAEIATALFNMGLIYKDKIEDLPMAITTFEVFIRRFNTDERIPDAYYQIYIMKSKQGIQADAEMYRTKLMTEFPDSKYQKSLSQPDYTDRLKRMYQEQDSIYNLTYKAYNENDYNAVFQQVAYIRQAYPLSTLMPKFLFLNALSIGKNESSDKFEIALKELVEKYPESDVSAMSKDILALMLQGNNAKTGTTSGSLLTLRDAEIKSDMNEISKEFKFSAERKTKHRLLLITSTATANLNRLLYNIASFNFSRFMIKDFDLVISKLDTVRSVVSVTNFESYEETDWYEKSIASDEALPKLLTDLQVQKVIISEENYALTRTSLSLDDYLAFQSKPVEIKQFETVTTTKPVKKQEIVLNAKVVAQKIVTTETTVETKTVDKPVVKQPEIPVVKPVAKSTTPPVVNEKEKTVVKQPEIPVNKPVVKSTTPTIEKEKPVPGQNEKPKQETVLKTAPVVSAVVQSKKEEVPLFKNLFAYQANEPHFVALYILSGTVDFEKTKAAIDAYNTLNYGIMNLKVSLEKVNNQQIIIIGSLSDANVAKSYLLRFVKEKSLFEGLKNANYRNLLGSQKNLNVLLQQNALSIYFEFMQEYYLK